ncbi:hypothetical protein C8R45DRAFT_1090231 [Mycena sanguinolenta]|nr:hypothetical protein C8R45DRAFT_1090231 [Mycena sanguinolenta]
MDVARLVPLLIALLPSSPSPPSSTNSSPPPPTEADVRETGSAREAPHSVECAWVAGHFVDVSSPSFPIFCSFYSPLILLPLSRHPPRSPLRPPRFREPVGAGKGAVCSRATLAHNLVRVILMLALTAFDPGVSGSFLGPSPPSPSFYLQSSAPSSYTPSSAARSAYPHPALSVQSASYANGSELLPSSVLLEEGGDNGDGGVYDEGVDEGGDEG